MGTTAFAAKVYQQPADFVKAQFGGTVPKAGVQTLTAAMQTRISKMNGGKYGATRVRYWSKGDKTVYILNDIGKTQPITTGYVIEAGKLTTVKVLIYRESHGSEVRNTYFTKQFKTVTLGANGRLSKKPRNIAGATLSVRSLTRMARVALFLHSQKK